MEGNLGKIIALYFILVAILIVTKPQIFYHDVDKTKLKPWNLWNETRNENDIVTLYSSVIMISVFCVLIC